MKRGGGTKRSSWITFKRRLFLVRLLLREPLQKVNLIAAIQHLLSEEGYPADSDSALKKDIDALRRDFDCHIVWNRTTKSYEVHTLGKLALLDLTDDGLAALQFLEANFPEGDALPEYVHIRRLFQQLRRMLPTDRQEQQAQIHAVSMQRSFLAMERIPAEVLHRLQRALWHQEVAFEYRSNQPDDKRFWHRVAPYEIIFHPNGHTYLEAATLEVTPAQPHVTLPKATTYRIDRIVHETITILPQTVQPHRLGVRTYSVQYWLHPDVARRRDVIPQFTDSVITYNDDTSATVVATTTNLWQAQQKLLMYGSKCVVLGPMELVDMFKQTIQEMMTSYKIDI